jgi:hypothetical protein
MRATELAGIPRHAQLAGIPRHAADARLRGAQLGRVSVMLYWSRHNFRLNLKAPRRRGRDPLW